LSGQELALLAAGVIGSIGAIRLVTSRNVVHAALYLVVALAMVAATYLILAAPFLWTVQILIYVGAIVVLLLFSLMLTRAPIGREALDNQQRGVALLSAVAVLAGLVYLVLNAFGDAPKFSPDPTATAAVGQTLFRSFVLPFEVVSVLLLAALIGAVVLARKDDR
jgi:NADH-quinone oxidoreductase subunit J